MSALALRSLGEMGHYALNLNWADGHESILPIRHLRAHCPCDTCAAIREEERPPGSADVQLSRMELIGDQNLHLEWSDNHDTWYLLAELRSLCRCAYCIGEPERPLTG